jgi:hypothetical protein
MPFKCPQCAQGGWVDWKNLNRALRCPKCTCRFLIDSDGQLRSFDDSQQVCFTCARCGKSGRIPAILVPRGVHCPGCKLPISVGMEIAAREEAAESARATGHDGTSGVDRHSRSMRAVSGASRWVAAAVGLVTVSGLALWSFSGGSSLDSTAAAFTQHCLAGRLDRAAEFIADDPYHRIEFERWFLRHFASIQVTHRPRGDRARVAAELVDELDQGDEQAALKLTMSSLFIGERTHRQIWRQQESGWLFDPVATLAEQDKSGIRR